jgi:ubiquinone/menaquinone biosynthesis C-methylase UbiE
MKDISNQGERLTTVAHENRIIVEHLHRYAIALEYVKDKVVLDIASGEGYGTNLLAQKATFVYGVDISPDAIAYSKNKYKKPNMKFVEGSAAQIPLEDSSVDVVVSFETIEHHDKHNEMMREFKRVLRPEGVVVISSPDKKYYTDITGFNNPFHVKELYSDQFLDLLKSYFSHVNMMKQGIAKGSFIYNANRNSVDKVVIFDGNFNQIETKENINMPDYNLIVASDQEVIVPSYSFFETNRFDIELKKLQNSTTYKIGKGIMAPYKFFSKSIKKISKKLGPPKQPSYE